MNRKTKIDDSQSNHRRKHYDNTSIIISNCDFLWRKWNNPE